MEGSIGTGPKQGHKVRERMSMKKANNQTVQVFVCFQCTYTYCTIYIYNYDITVYIYNNHVVVLTSTEKHTDIADCSDFLLFKKPLPYLAERSSLLYSFELEALCTTTFLMLELLGFGSQMLSAFFLLA